MLKTAIPFVDLRGKTPVDLLRAYPDKAHTLIRAARGTYGIWSKAASLAAMPLADRRSLKWLKKNRNPYLAEIESFADVLGARGIYALNISYEWGCTSGAYRTGETVSLLRVLDWPFPELGRHVMVTQQSGKAGEFYNITWPGVSGVFTGVAPGRFAAALNQAPMRRHHMGFIGDWIINRRMVEASNGLPPAHLLRQVFEQADSYETAKKMLMKTPLALPVIYVLTGPKAGQGCIIERTENDAVATDLAASRGIAAANQFATRLDAEGDGWRPREIDSAGRLRQSASIHGHEVQLEHFNWLQGPIINQRTRVAVVTDAASGRLMVQGYEGVLPVTELFKLPGRAVSGQADQMFA
jgi:hypothetical protein